MSFNNKQYIERPDEESKFMELIDAGCNIINLVGDGGIGKSLLLKVLLSKLEERKKDLIVLDLIDIHDTYYQTEIGILSTIAEQLDKDIFSKFITLVSNKRKNNVSEQYLNIFINSMKKYKSPHIVISLDTVENEYHRLSGFYKDTILLILNNLNFNCTFVLSGKIEAFKTEFLSDDDSVSTCTIKINKLSVLQVKKMLEKAGCKPTNNQAKQIHKKTIGKPILVALMIDLLNERSETYSLDYLIDISEDDFESEIIKKVYNQHEPVCDYIRYMYDLKYRFNAEIASVVIPRNKNKVNIELDQLKHFSFIKYRKNGDIDDEHSYLLHDEFYYLLEKYHNSTNTIEEQQERNFRKKSAVDKYYNKLIKRKNISHTEYVTLVREKLVYLLSISLSEGFNYWLEVVKKTSFSNTLECYNDILQRFSPALNKNQKDSLKYQQARVLLVSF